MRRHWWRTNLARSVMGTPTAVNRSIYWVVDIIAPHAAAWNSLFVVIQAAIGLALPLGRLDRLAIAASIPYALGIWWVGEGFGLLPTGFALFASGAPGAVLLYPLIGLLAWPILRSDPGQRTIIAQTAGAGAWIALWAVLSLLQVPWVYSARQVLGQHRGALVRPASLAAQHRRSRPTANGRRWSSVVAVVYWFGFQYLGKAARRETSPIPTRRRCLSCSPSLCGPTTRDWPKPGPRKRRRLGGGQLAVAAI